MLNGQKIIAFLFIKILFIKIAMQNYSESQFWECGGNKWRE